jgi:hypothetical protein
MRNEMRGRKIAFKTWRRGVVLFAFSLSILAAISCGLDPLDDTGAITLTIASPVPKTIAPNFDMTIASYVVSGSGPSGKTFSLTTTSTSVVKKSLKTGAWTITVSAMNAEGNTICQGSGSVSVLGPGENVPLTVAVSPLAGNGSLTVTVKWNPSSVSNASVTGQLTPPTGSAIPLTVSVSSGTATASASVPAGFYTMILHLLSSGVNVTGAVEVAWIIQGQTTSGSYDFTNAVATGALSVGISIANASPLTVALSGQKSSLSAGSSMTVTASASGYSGNVTYVWYLNGKSFNTGSSLTIGSGLTAGSNYRLDVAAFSANGLQAGSATCAFTVQ